MKPETKLGLFTVVGIAVLGFSLYFLGGLSVTRTYDINIKFQDVSGLPVKAPVKLAGVEIGKVKAIKIEDGGVVVVAAVDENIPLYKDTRFSVVMTGIIGTKYLKAVKGSAAAGVLKPGDYVQGTDEVPMDVMITQTMASIKELVDSVHQQGQFGKNLNASLQEVRQLSANLNQMVASMRPYLNNSVQNLDQISEQLKDVVAKADNVMTSLDNGDGVIGSLIKDPNMKSDVKESVTKLKETMTEVKTFVGKMSRFRIYWDYDFFYQPSSQIASSDLALEIYPSSGYTFYRAGIANIGNEDDTPAKGDYLERNKIDLRFGLYNRWASVSAGLIRGAGGVAMELRPFYDQEFLNRFTGTVEVTDWGRDRVINNRQFNKPNLTYGVDFRFNRYFSVGAWMRDALETNEFAVKANISFNDQDISSFFGMATLAR